MSRIKIIKATNLKAIKKMEADFKGCTAIITAGNDKGKSTFLRSIVDRIRFIRPEIPVTRGETEGESELILDSGERFVWEFDDKKKDKLTYFVKVNNKEVKQLVTKEFGRKFFPPVFDIDNFLASTPKEQILQLQKIVGLDFTDVDFRYEKAYADRTIKNRDAENYQAKLTSMLETDKVDPVDLTDLNVKKESERSRLNKLYQENKAHNDKLRTQHQVDCDNERKIIELFNKENSESPDLVILTESISAFNILKTNGYEDVAENASAFIGVLQKKIRPDRNYVAPVLPELIDPELPDDTELKRIDAEMLTASQTNVKAAEYQKYIDQKATTDAAKIEAKEADDLVKSIEAERKKMIAGAKFPEGITITDGKITVDGFPLDRDQIGSSKLYIAALKIGAIGLGEVKTMYFDASYLDDENLRGVNDWSESQGYQLLIEQPSRSGGEISYEIIEG